VVVEFWYPTTENNVPLDPTEDSVWIHPKEMRDVSISTTKTTYPLILMSHGHRGDRRERTWLVEPLVRQGFVVASVEHYGSAWNQYDPLASFRFWDRAKDISFALTSILQDPHIEGRIHTEKIGFIGYSMGGMTGLALAGAEARYAREIAIAQQQQVGEVPLEALDKIDFSEAEKNYQDARIKSILLLCPATFVYGPETLKRIKTPIGLVVSIDDEILPHKEHASKLLKYITPKKLKLMRNKTSHYAFLNKMTDRGYQLLQKASATPSAQNWGNVHKEVATFTIKFFQETLESSD
jgi:predicted dienelactone hydrolase